MDYFTAQADFKGSAFVLADGVESYFCHAVTSRFFLIVRLVTVSNVTLSSF